MEIKSFRLRNFRQFKSIDLEFSQNVEQPFTIITGGNTYGKTTLVKSFIWCLYGQKNFTDKILLNKDILDSMKVGETQEVKAIVELDHNNFSYKITTRESYIRMPSGDVRVQNKTTTSILKIGDAGNSIPIKTDVQIKEEIESILSVELSPYFFFDGETNNIETITRKSNLTNAVSEIMGLNRTELLQEYFNPNTSDNVVKRFQSKLDSNDPITTQHYQEQLDEKIEEKENKLQQVKENERIIDDLEIQIAEKEKILNAYQDILRDQKEKNDIIIDIGDTLKDKKNDIDKLKTALCSRNILLNSLFAYSFANDELEKKLNSSAFLTEKSISHISEEAIDELIERGYCLCGSIISNSNDAYKHLLDQKNYVEPRNYGKQVKMFIDNEKTNANYNSEHMKSLVENCYDITDEISLLEDLSNRLNTIIKRIEGKPDIGAVQTSIKNKEYQKNQIEGARNYLLDKEIPELDNKIEELNKKIQKLGINSEKNEFIEKCIGYSNKIYNMASQKILKEKDRIRKDLETTVGEIFTEMYTGNRKIIINDKFQVSTQLIDSSIIDTSKGLETVMNFSFVAGLMKLIKNKMSKEEDDFDQENTDENYPLIMDAPFSNTDEKHIANICANLPRYCNQIVIIVMDKDYNVAKESIMAKTGKRYVINKISETFAMIEEEN